MNSTVSTRSILPIVTANVLAINIMGYIAIDRLGRRLQQSWIPGMLRSLLFAMVVFLVLRLILRYLPARGKGFRVAIALLLFIPLYVMSAQQLYVKRLRDTKARNAVSVKIEPNPRGMAAGGWKGQALNFTEYDVLRGELSILPDLAPQADSIAFGYGSDGFLPDYYLQLSYRLPKSTPVAAFNRDDGRNELRQTVDDRGAFSHVHYFEGRQ